jgi:hypothetical protein
VDWDKVWLVNVPANVFWIIMVLTVVNVFTLLPDASRKLIDRIGNWARDIGFPSVLIVKSNWLPDATVPPVNEVIVAVIVFVDEFIEHVTDTTLFPATQDKLATEVGKVVAVGNWSTIISVSTAGVWGVINIW